MRRFVATALIAFCLTLTSFAQHSKSSSGPYYGGGHHTESHGGHYKGGSGGSSHKGGHYSSPTGSSHYGHHK